MIALADCYAFGQRSPSLPAQVNGQVRYAKGGAPADQILVRLESFGGGIVSQVTTDRTGKFRFSGLIPDQYTVTVHASGFREMQQHVDLKTNNTEYVIFQLIADDSSKIAARSSAPGVVDANVPPAAQKEFERAEAAFGNKTQEGLREGVRHLENAVSIYPKFIQAQLRLGTSYMDLQQWHTAEEALLKTIEIDPKTANAFFALGEVYLRQKKDEEAEKTLLQGLQIEDHSYQGHLTLGRVYWDMAVKIKDEAQARQFLEKSYEQTKRALELEPNLAGAHLLKGNLLLRVRRGEDAMHEFEEYLRLDPKGPFAEQTRTLVEKIKKALATQPK